MDVVVLLTQLNSSHTCTTADDGCASGTATQKEYKEIQRNEAIQRNNAIYTIEASSYYSIKGIEGNQGIQRYCQMAT